MIYTLKTKTSSFLASVHSDYLPFFEMASDEEIASFVRAQVQSSLKREVPELHGMAKALYDAHIQLMDRLEKTKQNKSRAGKESWRSRSNGAQPESKPCSNSVRTEPKQTPNSDQAIFEQCSNSVRTDVEQISNSVQSLFEPVTDTVTYKEDNAHTDRKSVV